MNNFRVLRMQKGLSQAELANILCVNQTAVSQWERGVTTPSRNLLFKLCDLYDTTIDFLLGRTTSQNIKDDLTRQRVVELFDKNKSICDDLLQELGFKRSDLESWRIGESTSFMSQLEKIAELFMVSVPYLLGKTDIENAPPTIDGGAKIEGVDELLEIYRDLNPAKKKKLIAQARLEAEEQEQAK